jgi:predicted ATPase
MNLTGEKLFVVTGGPGAGKTTLLAAAAVAGYSTWPEAGRAIIQSQLAIGGRALPWADRALYAELMLDRDMQVHAAASASGQIALCDRGVPDLLGYARRCGLNKVAHIRKAVELFRYNHTVFIAPPWREIYAQDTERKQDWAEAVATFEALASVYEELGYCLAELPKVDVAGRLEFVVETIVDA